MQDKSKRTTVITGKTQKDTFLIRSSLLLLLLLACLHIYCLHCTYLLARSAYFKDVAFRMLTEKKRPQISVPVTKTMTTLTSLVEQYYLGALTKEQAVSKFNFFLDQQRLRQNPLIKEMLKKDDLLHDVHYLCQVDGILLSHDQVTDTIFLSRSGKPVFIFGEEIPNQTDDTLLIAADTLRSIVSGTERINGHRRSFVVSLAKSDYIDFSHWKQQVVLRMSTIFLLTVTLISVMIAIVLYLLRAIFKEKQLVLMQADFANNINHELNTPLSSIAINIKNLKRPDIYGNKIAYDLQINLLQRQYLKLRYIVDQILESEAGRHPKPQLRSLNITKALLSIAALIQVPERIFFTDISPEDVILSTDINIIERVIDQLLENAIKYSAPGEPIKLSAFRTGLFYLISVEDKGRGISKKFHDKIFKKFYRVHVRDEDNTKGLGLGLYLSRKTLHLIDGELEVQSELGFGSKFTIKIPIR